MIAAEVPTDVLVSGQPWSDADAARFGGLRDDELVRHFRDVDPMAFPCDKSPSLCACADALFELVMGPPSPDYGLPAPQADVERITGSISNLIANGEGPDAAWAHQIVVRALYNRRGSHGE